MVLEYIIITLLAFLSGYLGFKYLELRKRYLAVNHELNSQSLDYHLNKIRQAGYEFTLKGSTHKKKAAIVKKPSGSFSDLIEDT